MSMGRKIFISYRREADAGHAGRLYEDLSERFCRRNLFIDLELRPGQQWQERIEQAVGACDVVLPVIGTRWATVTKERESGRLERSEDWVKLEIETALMRQDVVVIPVLVGGAQMPAAADLPESLRPMTKWQAQHLSDHSWSHDLERLIRAIPRPPAAALILWCLLGAFLAGLLAGWLVKELPTSAGEDQAAAIAISMARRALLWGLVGAAIAAALLVARGRCPHALSRSVAGLAVGALAGAAGGLVDAVPDIANQEEPASWVDPAALAVTGALVGALLGRLWPRGHWSIGLALGAGAGLLAHAAMAAPEGPVETAVRSTLLVGVVLAGLAAVDLASGLATQRDQAGPRLSRPRFP